MTCRSCTAFLEVLLPELLYRTFASERSMLRTQSTYVQAGADLVWLELEHHWKKKKQKQRAPMENSRKLWGNNKNMKETRFVRPCCGPKLPS